METFGRYDILGELGRGGMGAVYRARARDSGLEVALKLLLTDHFAPLERERFLREAQATAQLRHPGIITVHEGGAFQGKLFLALELIGGGSLQDRILREGRLPPEEVWPLALALADALDHAHQRGVLHRDLKPANVLLREDGSPVITDFGLAKGRHVGGGHSLTQSGEVVGSPAYMPPEQAMGTGKSATSAADVYGLGATLYSAVTGQPPFLGKSVLEVLRLVVDEEPRPLASGDPSLDALVMRCMAKAAGDRPSARDLVVELEGRLEATTATRRTPRLRVVGGICALLAAGGVGAALGTQGARSASSPPPLSLGQGPTPSPPANRQAQAPDLAPIREALNTNPLRALARLDALEPEAQSDPAVELLRVKALWQAEHLDELQRRLALLPQTAEPLLRARLDVRLGRYERAQALYEVNSPSDEVKALWADALTGKGDLERAEAIYSELEARGAKGWRAGRARLRRYQGRFELAHADATAGTLESPGDARPHAERARSRIERSQFRQAKSELDAAIQALGERPSLSGQQAWLARAELGHIRKGPHKAVLARVKAASERALTVDSTEPWALVARCVVKFRKQVDRAQLLRELELAARRDRTGEWLRGIAAQVRLHEGQLAAELRLSQAPRDLQRTHEGQVLWAQVALGRARASQVLAQRTKHLAAAEEHVSRALTRRDSCLARVVFARIHMLRGERSHQRRQAERALRLARGGGFTEDFGSEIVLHLTEGDQGVDLVAKGRRELDRLEALLPAAGSDPLAVALGCTKAIEDLIGRGTEARRQLARARALRALAWAKAGHPLLAEGQVRFLQVVRGMSDLSAERRESLRAIIRPLPNPALWKTPADAIAGLRFLREANNAKAGLDFSARALERWPKDLNVQAGAARTIAALSLPESEKHWDHLAKSSDPRVKAARDYLLARREAAPSPARVQALLARAGSKSDDPYTTAARAHRLALATGSNSGTTPTRELYLGAIDGFGEALNGDSLGEWRRARALLVSKLASNVEEDFGSLAPAFARSERDLLRVLYAGSARAHTIEIMGYLLAGWTKLTPRQRESRVLALRQVEVWNAALSDAESLQDPWTALVERVRALLDAYMITAALQLFERVENEARNPPKELLPPRPWFQRRLHVLKSEVLGSAPLQTEAALKALLQVKPSWGALHVRAELLLRLGEHNDPLAALAALDEAEELRDHEFAGLILRETRVLALIAAERHEEALAQAQELVARVRKQGDLAKAEVLESDLARAKLRLEQRTP